MSTTMELVDTLIIDRADAEHDSTKACPQIQRGIASRRRGVANATTRILNATPGREELVNNHNGTVFFPRAQATVTAAPPRASAIASSSVRETRIGKRHRRSYSNNTISDTARAHFGDVYICFNGDNARITARALPSVRAKAHLLCTLLAELLCEIPAALGELMFASKPIPRPGPGTYAIFMISEDGLSTGIPSLVDLGVIDTWEAFLTLFLPKRLSSSRSRLLTLGSISEHAGEKFLACIWAGKVYQVEYSAKVQRIGRSEVLKVSTEQVRDFIALTIPVRSREWT